MKIPTILSVTKCGQAIKINADDYYEKEKGTYDECGFIKLAKGDAQLPITYTKGGAYETVLCMTSNGFGMMIRTKDIRFVPSGGSGVSFVKISPLSWFVVSVGLILPTQHRVTLVLTSGKKHPLNKSEIPLLKRGSSPVSIVDLPKGERVEKVIIS